MHKKTLEVLAQPAATVVLALSIISVPLIGKAELSQYDEIYVTIKNPHELNLNNNCKKRDNNY